MKSFVGVGLSEGVLAKTSVERIDRVGESRVPSQKHGEKHTRVGDTILLSGIHCPLSLCEFGRSNHFHRLQDAFSLSIADSIS